MSGCGPRLEGRRHLCPTGTRAKCPHPGTRPVARGTESEREPSISQRAAVLARIGSAGQRALVPVDPDRLTAAERPDHAGGLVPELLQALDDGGGHTVLELIDALVMQAARHIDRFLHVATVV